MKHSTPGTLFGVRLQPATLEAEIRERRRGRPADHAEPHHADRDLAGCRLGMRTPDPLALLGVVEPLAPVVHQHMQHDIFGHPHAEIGMDDARDRHRRQCRIIKQMIHTGAQVDDGFKPGKRASSPCGGSQTQA